MPGGSVTAKVSSVKLNTDRFITSGGGDDHSNILHLLQRFAVDKDEQRPVLSLALDNGVEILINSDLIVTIPALTASQNKSGKIMRAVAWRMKDEAFPSRCDMPSDSIWVSTDRGRDVHGVLYEFSVARIRCSLMLEIDNGLEISIYPSLKADVPALDEQGGLEFDYDSRPIWDIKVILWPMLESWLGLESESAAV